MSSPITFILADDEELYRDYSLMQLEKVSGIHCVAVCENAFEAREKIIQLQPDFVILDIEMPGLTGMQLVKSLNKVPLVIFVTSHLDYAVDAFELDAVDYLVKPVTTERMLRAVDKVKTFVTVRQDQASLEISETATSFFIRENNQYTKINYEDVLHIESLGNFVLFHLNNGAQKMALVSLNQLEQQLTSPNFVRISRSAIVNKQYVTAIHKDNILSLGSVSLPMGKTFVNEALTKIMGGTAIKRHQ